MRAKIYLLMMLLLVSTHVLAQQSNAHVQQMAATLNLRTSPSPFGAVIVELAGGTPLTVLGRNATGTWLKVRTVDAEPLEGWASSGFIVMAASIDSLPVLSADIAPQTPSQPTQPDSAPAAPSVPTTTAGAGSVVVQSTLLNLRASPSTRSAVLTQLPFNTTLTALSRTADSAWLQVRTASGQEGWVAAAYVQVRQNLDGLGVANVQSEAPVISGAISGSAATRAIFQNGQKLGNRAAVFSKVGDSITTSTDMYDPIGRGVYNLGGYGHLQRVIDYYTSVNNSFTQVSKAAGAGWTTSAVLDPKFADPSMCDTDESPLMCEYRISKPALALIMLGSNDVRFVDPGTYGWNLNRIAEISIEQGIVPVFSTIPNRIGYEAQVNQYNGIIREVARKHGVPLWDYYGAMATLPNWGLSDDGLHPSASPAGYSGAADFNGENLNYGYVMRNLTMLQTLHALTP